MSPDQREIPAELSQSSQAPAGSRLRELKMHDVQEKIENLTDELRSRASRMASDASDKMVEYYDDATEWLSDNYGIALAVAGGVAAIGLAAYFFFRRRDRYEPEDLSKLTA